MWNEIFSLNALVNKRGQIQLPDLNKSLENWGLILRNINGDPNLKTDEDGFTGMAYVKPVKLEAQKMSKR